MQEFYINKDSTLPLLKMELVNDGRTDFNKFYELIQNSTIMFTMEDYDTGIVKIANETAIVLPKDGCGDEYYIAYKWRLKDTKKRGKYIGKFTIRFNIEAGGGILIVPIQEQLIITIQ